MEAVDPTGGVAHLIQTALTPVFLLSGIAALLGVFNTRLAQVSDHLSHLADLSRGDLHPDEAATLKSHLLRLALRTLTLDASVALGAVGGAATCGAAFVLFLGSVRESGVRRLANRPVLSGARLHGHLAPCIYRRQLTGVAWAKARRADPAFSKWPRKIASRIICLRVVLARRAALKRVESCRFGGYE